MWLSDDGRFNILAVDDPGDYFAPELRAALKALPDRELILLELQVNDVRDSLMEELHGRPPADEDRYRNQVLPKQYELKLLDPSESLYSQIAQQIDETPLRWRLERAFLLSQYVADIGPKLRRYARIVTRLQRDGT